MTWWRRLLGRTRLEAELDAELRDHMERQAAEHVSSGLTEAEARRRTYHEFGGLDAVKELCRDVRGTRWLEEIVQDVRHSMRLFAKSPGISTVAVLSLALGIATPLVAYSFVRAVLAPEVTADDPGRLRRVEVRRGSGEAWSGVSFAEYRDLAAAHAAPPLAAYAPSRDCQMVVRVGDGFFPVSCSIASVNYFEVLDASMGRGRAFGAEAVHEETDHAIVISHGFWRRRWVGDSPLGRTLVLDGVTHVVVGVLPANFRSVEPHGVVPDVFVRADATRVQAADSPSGRRFDLLAPHPGGHDRG